MKKKLFEEIKGYTDAQINHDKQEANIRIEEINSRVRDLHKKCEQAQAKLALLNGFKTAYGAKAEAALRKEPVEAMKKCFEMIRDTILGVKKGSKNLDKVINSLDDEEDAVDGQEPPRPSAAADVMEVDNLDSEDVKFELETSDSE